MFVVPPATDPAFIDCLCQIIESEHIEYYLPTHSKEMRSVALAYDRIVQTGCKVMVSSAEAFASLDDKLLANRHLSSIGVPVPKMFDSLDQTVEFPIFVKQRLGSGSSNVEIVTSKERLRHLCFEGSQFVAFEYLSGKEYTVDCMFDMEGNLLALNQRERVKTLGGAVTVTQNTTPIDIVPLIERIAKHWLLRGCANFQYILVNGIPYFIDINLRYPSGGLPLTVESGIDVPEMTMRLLNGEHIAWGEYASDCAPRTMYRFFDEIFEVAS